MDEAIMQVVEEHLTDAKFLAAVFRRLKETPQSDTRADREKELAKLAARRRKWIEQYDADRIGKQEFEQKIDAVTRAVREIEATMPAAPPPSLWWKRWPRSAPCRSWISDPRSSAWCGRCRW